MSLVCKVRSRRTAALLVILASTVLAAAAPGELDPAFGADGVALDPAFTLGGNTPVSIAVQTTGRIVAGGFGEGGTFLLRRYLPDGTPDGTFAGTGSAVVLGGAHAGGCYHLCVDGTDRIVATGAAEVVTNARKGTWEVRVATIRLLADGTLDSSFGSGGTVVSGIVGRGQAVAVQPDGRIVVAGTRPYTSKGRTSDACCLLRYNENGTADTTFGSSGVVTHDLTTANDWVFVGAIGLQSNGTIVVGANAGFTAGVGYSLPGVVARYSPTGTLLDTTTGAGDFLRGIAVDSYDRIVAVGQRAKSNGVLDVVVARYLSSGETDISFGSGGTLVGNNASTTRGQGVRIAPDDRIIVGIQYGDLVFGGNASASVARVLDSGAWDPDFGTGGFGTPVYEDGRVHQVYEPALDSAGNPIIGGRAWDDTNPITNKSLFLARYVGS